MEKRSMVCNLKKIRINDNCLFAVKQFLNKFELLNHLKKSGRNGCFLIIPLSKQRNLTL
jgi:hypothetical protein